MRRHSSGVGSLRRLKIDREMGCEPHAISDPGGRKLLDAGKPLHRAQRFIAGLDAGAAFDPCPAIATNRDDRIGPAPGNGGVTVSGIIGAIAVDAEDRLILGDLRQKRRKGRRITDGVGRDLDCPDIQGLRIDPDMNLAPLAAIGSAVLPCFPFAFAHHLDSGAVDQQVQTA